MSYQIKTAAVNSANVDLTPFVLLEIDKAAPVGVPCMLPGRLQTVCRQSDVILPAVTLPLSPITLSTVTRHPVTFESINRVATLSFRQNLKCRWYSSSLRRVPGYEMEPFASQMKRTQIVMLTSASQGHTGTAPLQHTRKSRASHPVCSTSLRPPVVWADMRPCLLWSP